jgi:hypothetical protein
VYKGVKTRASNCIFPVLEKGNRTKKNLKKFACGCIIIKGRSEQAFEIFPCVDHNGTLNIVSWPLKKIENYIQRTCT